MMDILTQFVHKTYYANKDYSHKRCIKNLICTPYTNCVSGEFGLENAEKVDLRVILEDDNAKQFLAIKKAKGISQNTEVIRSVITDYYNEHVKPSIQVPL